MSIQQELQSTIRDLCVRGKGILAADESTRTIEKRFKKINTPSTEENRRFYRELLFTAPDMGSFICGVILFEETLEQKTGDGVPFPKVLSLQKSAPGIKVDQGTAALAGSPKELVTQGLDGLDARMKSYKSLGARFAKWRGVITIGDGLPTDACIEANAHALARYAAICQENGIVPIVEPEVLMDGNHTLERCYEATVHTLKVVFDELHLQRVVLEHMILKPNMVISGLECPRQANPQEIAEWTLRCFRRVVPCAVPGIFFLSGGQSDEAATVNLNAINAASGAKPWMLSFSYGRALQSDALNRWQGDAKQKAAAQKGFLHRARLNAAAQRGEYKPAMEKELVGV